MKTSTFKFNKYFFQLIADEHHVVSLNRVDHQELIIHPEHQRWIKDINDYESGLKKRFDWNIQFSNTEFQKKVFMALQSIPYGETRTYHEVAIMIQQPKAARAVGQAISKNPVLIVIPCHRVLAKHGLGGFSSGLDLKESLLSHEHHQ
ncbi:MAG: methylated-DNA--[protein]-cysteine S-methyltransferase [Erysipelothrix sp.]|jgi:O-6-methylguanine DNA methyltransferase|nr:methylated-DNA--[protein]-cysteine S-methyltransferase [Erysipelothrix sp.]